MEKRKIAVTEILSKKGEWLRTKHGVYNQNLDLEYELLSGKKGVVPHGKWRILIVESSKNKKAAKGGKEKK